jgi:preprotein translocase subunit SecG
MNWIGVLLLVIYIISCIALILIVLLQAGKGATLGASFGGGASQTVFGARSATFIGRLTWVLAAIFMACALILTKISPWGERGVESGSKILHEEPISQSQAPGATQPVAPETAPAGEVAPKATGETQQAQTETQPSPAETQPQPESKPQHPQPKTQGKP